MERKPQWQRCKFMYDRIDFQNQTRNWCWLILLCYFLLVKGIRTSWDCRIYATSAEYPEFSNKDKILISYTLYSPEQKLDSGGGYMKLRNGEFDPKKIGGKPFVGYISIWFFVWLGLIMSYRLFCLISGTSVVCLLQYHVWTWYVQLLR